MNLDNLIPILNIYSTNANAVKLFQETDIRNVLADQNSAHIIHAVHCSRHDI